MVEKHFQFVENLTMIVSAVSCCTCSTAQALKLKKVMLLTCTDCTTTCSMLYVDNTPGRISNLTPSPQSNQERDLQHAARHLVIRPTEPQMAQIPLPRDRRLCLGSAAPTEAPAEVAEEQPDAWRILASSSFQRRLVLKAVEQLVPLSVLHKSCSVTTSLP